MKSDRYIRRRTSVIRFFGRAVMSTYTAGSMIFLREAGGLVAVVEPRRAPEQWTFPGGFHRRKSEDPRTAVVREVWEELSLDLNEAPTPVTVYRQSGRPHYDHLFSARIKEVRPKIRPRSGLWNKVELKRAEWIDITQPAIWDALIPEARFALREFDRCLNLGLNDV